MRNPLPFLLLTGLALASPALGAEEYLCAADRAVGFSFNTAAKEWRPATFKADEKLVIRRAFPDEAAGGAVWAVKRMGRSAPDYLCTSDFGPDGYLGCSGWFGEFSFNRISNRFMSVYRFGYVTTQRSDTDVRRPEGSDTPYMQIGQCNPL